MKVIYLSFFALAFSAPFELGEPIGPPKGDNTLSKWIARDGKARLLAALAALGLGIAGLGVAVDQKNKVIEATKEREQLAKEIQAFPPFPVKNETQPVSVVPQHSTAAAVPLVESQGNTGPPLGQVQQVNQTGYLGQEQHKIAQGVPSLTPTATMSYVTSSIQLATTSTPLFEIGL